MRDLGRRPAFCVAIKQADANQAIVERATAPLVWQWSTTKRRQYSARAAPLRHMRFALVAYRLMWPAGRLGAPNAELARKIRGRG
jgi:hypothetical protein